MIIVFFQDGMVRLMGNHLIIPGGTRPIDATGKYVIAFIILNVIIFNTIIITILKIIILRIIIINIMIILLLVIPVD